MAGAGNVKPPNIPKLRLLALHGYRQNGDTFKAKIGSFRKIVTKYANIIFLTAPHVVKSDDEQEADDKG